MFFILKKLKNPFSQVNAYFYSRNILESKLNYNLVTIPAQVNIHFYFQSIRIYRSLSLKVTIPAQVNIHFYVDISKIKGAFAVVSDNPCTGQHPFLQQVYFLPSKVAYFKASFLLISKPLAKTTFLIKIRCKITYNFLYKIPINLVNSMLLISYPQEYFLHP